MTDARQTARSETLSLVEARRLALARAGLLNRRFTGMPERAAGRGRRALAAALAVLGRFGYLQLDTVAVAGARSHAIVLLSRIDGLDPEVGESLLRPGAPLFEYWGHEASWIPIELYPTFEFRRRQFQSHPWWGDLIRKHRQLADRIVKRIGDEGPLRSVDLEGASGKGWWDLKPAKKVAAALWSAGRLAIRERRSFQRSYDLVERVIPATWREREEPYPEALKTLLERALAGHGWATLGTLAATWRLRNCQADLRRALAELAEEGRVVRCHLETRNGVLKGFVRPRDLELAARLRRVRPRRDRGILLSPFDPVLWDRARVRLLFDFDQVCEIFKPPAQRRYGYYCLPVLAGDRLVARIDLKAHTRERQLEIKALHYEAENGGRPESASAAAVSSALERYSETLGLELRGADA